MPSPHPHPWRKASHLGDGPRVPLCRERRAVWRARLTLNRRARKITPLGELIGQAMIRRLGVDGRLDPSHQTLADDVGCDARSVRRALAAFQACGLVVWTRRIVRAGWRVEQTSNAYMLTVGDPPVIPAFRCGGQAVRPTRKKDFSSVPSPVSEPSPGDRLDAMARLARVAAQQEAAFHARFLGQRTNQAARMA